MKLIQYPEEVFLLNYRKIVILILLVCSSVTITWAQNQRINLNITNQSLLTAFEDIEKQTRLSISYNQTKLDVHKNITVNFQNARLQEIMQHLLNGTGFSFIFEGEHIVIVPASSVSPDKATTSQATTQTINGIVVDEQGQPVIGANVTVPKTNIGTITGLDGQFSLQIPPGTLLSVTFIGYDSQTNVATRGRDFIRIVLKESVLGLDEVVVVGFGTQKKVNLTGAVAPVNIKESLGDRPLSSVASALQGMVPGLKIESATGSPGESMTYNIRGTTSINGGEPLVLVNNVPMDINMIDPQEIESVSILKDAASAAIYGARAAFGVILITTKQGAKATAPTFNYNNNFSFSKASELPQKASPLESVLAYKNMEWPNDTYVDGKNISQWEWYIRDYLETPSKYPNGWLFDEGGNLFLMRERDMFADMMDNFGFMQNHSFSVSGGSEKSTYRIGLGYTDENGILITDKDSYDRINLSTFLGVDITKWFTAQIDIKYANSNQSKVEQGGRNGLWGAAMALPSYQNNEEYEQDGVVYPPESSATYIRYGEPRHIKKNDLRILGRVIFTPLKGLKLTGEYTYNHTSTNNKMYKNKYPYIGMNFNGIMNSVENSSYALTQNFTDYNAINLFANYDISFGAHSFSVMGGFNQEWSHYETSYVQKLDVLIPSLPSISMGTGTTTASDGFDEYAIRGLFYRVNYAYAGKYLLEANGRYDGSSRFPSDNRFGFFPSFSAGWRISEESFMEKSRNWLDNLKLRASWGVIGNQIIYKKDANGNNIPDNYPYIPDMSVYLSNWLVNGQKVTSLKAPNMVSNTLTWEKVYTLDFGIDIDLLSNRLNATFDWYRRDTKGMLAPGMDLPWVVGTTAAKQNAADLQTYGWELSLNWRDRIGKVGYRLGFNISDSQSKITKYQNESGLLGDNTYYEGMKIGEIWGYVTDRLYTENDFNADGTLKAGIPKFYGAGQINPGDVLYKNFDDDTEYIYQGDNTIYNPGDQKIIGNKMPRYMYGITGGVSYKGFDLSFFLRGVGKRDYWRKDQIAWPTGTWGSLFKETLDFWSPDNPNAFYPRTYANNVVNTSYNRKTQTRYLANAAFIKLQNITLSYTLPKEWCRKIYFDDIKVFVSGENLYTWDHLPKGLDPDMLTKDAWDYPFMAKYSLGINVTF